jgi:hypothetical protein
LNFFYLKQVWGVIVGCLRIPLLCFVFWGGVTGVLGVFAKFAVNLAKRDETTARACASRHRYGHFRVFLHFGAKCCGVKRGNLYTYG